MRHFSVTNICCIPFIVFHSECLCFLSFSWDIWTKFQKCNLLRIASNPSTHIYNVELVNGLFSVLFFVKTTKLKLILTIGISWERGAQNCPKKGYDITECERGAQNCPKRDTILLNVRIIQHVSEPCNKSFKPSCSFLCVYTGCNPISLWS